MPFDALALHAVTDELRATALGGRVQKVVLPAERTLGLEVFAGGRRRWLLCSADPSAARAHLSPTKPGGAGDMATPFLLLIRKYVRDARLVEITQPPLERLLQLRFRGGTRDRGPHEVVLMLELMGRRSNFVLVDEDGAIMDALIRVSAQTNPVRPLLPHRRYMPPPIPDRLDPRLASSYVELAARVGRERPEGSLSQYIQTHLAGISPFLATEMTFRAVGSTRHSLAQGVPVDALQVAAGELFTPLETHDWEPHVILRDDSVVDAVPYLPRHVAADELAPVESMSEGLSRVQPSAPRPPAVSLRRPLLASVSSRRDQLERRHAALHRALERAAGAERLRLTGDCLLAHAHVLEPGQAVCNYDGLEIAMDPSLTAVENAQRYFRDYRRARDAARVVPALVTRTERELAYLAEVVNLIDLATDQTALEQLRRELVAAGLVSPNRADAKRARAPKPHGGFRRVPIGDFGVLVGTTALGNEHVTFDLGAPDDVWLHAHGVPGSHVLIRTAGRPVPVGVLREAARLAAAHSTARDQVSVAVDWTLRKYVRKIRGAGPGLVTYAREQSLTIRPGKPDPSIPDPPSAG